MAKFGEMKWQMTSESGSSAPSKYNSTGGAVTSTPTPAIPVSPDPFAGPSPMDLIKIVDVFRLLPDAFPDPRKRAFRGGMLEKIRNTDAHVAPVLAMAAHIYWLARQMALKAGHEDPSAAMRSEGEGREALRRIEDIWREVVPPGRQITEEEAIRRLDYYKTINGLRDALTKFGYPHIPGTTINENAVPLLDQVRTRMEKSTAAYAARRRRRLSSLESDSEKYHGAAQHLTDSIDEMEFKPFDQVAEILREIGGGPSRQSKGLSNYL